jgi:glycosyltransferase involved in cell wall biosynthesis
VRIALVTTPPSMPGGPSGIADYTRHLLPHLLERCEIQLFVARGLEGESLHGLRTRSVDELLPREFDQILYQLGNERGHAFMARLVRTLGGTVALHDWVLFDLALAAFPALARGGVKGHLLALREGGPSQLRIYSANWRARRRQRLEPRAGGDPSRLPGILLSGWHAPEPTGRWTGDVAWFRVPADSGSCARVRVVLHSEAGRTVSLSTPAGPGARITADGAAGQELALELGPALRDGPAAPREFALETSPIRVGEEQRRHGDTRRLGSFVRRIEFEDPAGLHELDLRQPAREPLESVDLARDRFALPLNRSIVRFGDAFLVHSQHVRERILEERNAPTPIGVVHHGAQARWRDGDRRAARPSLGLPAEWQRDFLVTSFGALQPHKRIDKLLEALFLARRTHPRIRLALIGREEPESLDARALAQRLGLEGAVHFAGHVEEATAWELIHAGDLAVQLRGPSTGGSSGGLFQSLSLGRAVLASDAPELREVPGECVARLDTGPEEARELAKRLVELCDRPAELERMEQAARAFVRSSCGWPLVAQAYVEFLERFPRPRSARKSLFVVRLRRALRAAKS